MPGFNTPQNKGAIWNLMFEEGMFQGINDNQVKNVKKDFDAKVNDIAGRNPNSKNLTSLNKTVITEMMDDVRKYTASQAFSGDENPARGKQGLPQPPRGTAREVSDQRQKQFQKGLESRQNDFSGMMNKGIPANIDFSDETDKPIGDEMDNMVANFITDREKQLNVVLDTQDSREGGEWINKDNTNSVLHIKIGDEAKLDTRSIVEVAPKQVTFSQATPSIEMPGFLNKLKKKPDDNKSLKKKLDDNKSLKKKPDDHTSLKKKPDDFTSLNEKLDRILRGQDEILGLLRKSEPSNIRLNYASQEPDDGARKYNDDRNWNGEHLTPGT